MVRRIAPSQIANAVSGQPNGIRTAYAYDESFGCKKKKVIANACKPKKGHTGVQSSTGSKGLSGHQGSPGKSGLSRVSSSYYYDPLKNPKEAHITNAKKSPMARVGKSNGRWKGGVSKTYYRRIAGAKPNDGTIVHHKDHDKKNPSRKNLEKIKPGKKISARGKHNQRHPNRRNGKA
ncbi:MAG TPA: hypothetical protein VI815_03050 [Candidatus Nanoarchaeia archaeon]|nr:hypothetical protein [Candidatus Nanoarchaeia archaeon]